MGRGQGKGEVMRLILQRIFTAYILHSVSGIVTSILYTLSPLPYREGGTIILILRKINLPVLHRRLLGFEARSVSLFCEFSRSLPKNRNVGKGPKIIWRLKV